MYRTWLGVSKEFVHIVKAMEQRESTAPCKDVSKEFVLIGYVLRKRSVFILYFTHPHLFNENKLRTHTLQSKVRYFHVTPLALGTKFPLKPGRAATDETVGRSRPKLAS